VFTTARDNQTRVEIDCCRGEARRYTENEPLGTLLLENLTPKPRGELKIEVSFRVDADGILHVRAADQASGTSREAHLRCSRTVGKIMRACAARSCCGRSASRKRSPHSRTSPSTCPHGVARGGPDCVPHRSRKLAHPILHRSLGADDLEVVTLAYSRCAGAYQECAPS